MASKQSLEVHFSQSGEPYFQNFPSRTQPWWVLLEDSISQTPQIKIRSAAHVSYKHLPTSMKMPLNIVETLRKD